MMKYKNSVRYCRYNKTEDIWDYSPDLMNLVGRKKEPGKSEMGTHFMWYTREQQNVQKLLLYGKGNSYENTNY